MSRRADLNITDKVADVDDVIVGSVGIGIVANVIVAIILIVGDVDVMVVIGVGVGGVARGSGRALVISHRVSQG